jgi:hypothetical protein
MTQARLAGRWRRGQQGQNTDKAESASDADRESVQAANGQDRHHHDLLFLLIL